MTRASRYGTAVSVILCDIDHFKAVNDTYGHTVGDQVLIAFAGLLRSMTRESVDSVIRYGGEEFLLVLPATELAGTHALADRIRVAFAGTVTSAGQGGTVSATASFGIATVPMSIPGFQTSAEAVIGVADTGLYAAKRGGRNAVSGAHVLSGLSRDGVRQPDA